MYVTDLPGPAQSGQPSMLSQNNKTPRPSGVKTFDSGSRDCCFQTHYGSQLLKYILYQVPWLKNWFSWLSSAALFVLGKIFRKCCCLRRSDRVIENFQFSGLIQLWHFPLCWMHESSRFCSSIMTPPKMHLVSQSSLFADVFSLEPNFGVGVLASRSKS